MYGGLHMTPSVDSSWTYVRRDFMHRLFVVPHGTLGSYLCDALQEGGAIVVAYLLALRAYACLPPVFLL
jgi:hypothetical protein